jgi:hypothetical protein
VAGHILPLEARPAKVRDPLREFSRYSAGAAHRATRTGPAFTRANRIHRDLSPFTDEFAFELRDSRENRSRESSGRSCRVDVGMTRFRVRS